MHKNGEWNDVFNDPYGIACWRKLDSTTESEEATEESTDGNVFFTRNSTSLLKIACENGWQEYGIGDEKYCLKNIGSFAGDVAQAECEKLDADLPLPANAEQNSELLRIMGSLSIGEAWLALFHQG